MLLLTVMIQALGGAARQTGEVDEGLIASIADGDKAALAALYAQTSTAVYSFALSLVKSPQTAEDVMQDTYVRVFQAAGQYEPRGKPMAWILTIARNLALMSLRKKTREGPALTEDWDIADSFDQIENSTDRLTLNVLLKLLSGEERQVIFLHLLSGLKHREIADLLDMPLSTVLSKYHRALGKLRKYGKEGA